MEAAVQRTRARWLQRPCPLGSIARKHGGDPYLKATTAGTPHQRVVQPEPSDDPLVSSAHACLPLEVILALLRALCLVRRCRSRLETTRLQRSS